MLKFLIVLLTGVILLGTGCTRLAASPAANTPAVPSVKPETESLPAPKTANPPSASSDKKATEAPLSVTYAIKINNFNFSPAEIKSNKGDKVVWQHDDAAAHTVVSVGNFESPVLSRGGQFSFTFNKAGEFDYYCGIHPSMRGKIIVK